jgi:uncharacterized protein YndB with AHSA1/START domain
MSSPNPYSISRIFKAPRKLVWEVQTKPEHLAKWLSPEGFESIHANQDFRVGGIYHYGLRGPGGMEMWGKQVYREIVPLEKIVVIQTFSDKDGGLTRHPMAPTWPAEMLSTTTFEDAGKDTKLTISWHPYNSDEAGNATFEQSRSSMDQGFAGTFAKLEAYLASLQ